MVIKSHTLILLVACLIAASSTVFLLARQNNKTAVPPLTYQCFKTENGWGYNILADNKIIIRQPFLPGVAGKAGFDQQQQAATVARIVIEKIKSGEMPTISHQQLQRLGVLHTQDK